MLAVDLVGHVLVSHVLAVADYVLLVFSIILNSYLYGVVRTKCARLMYVELRLYGILMGETEFTAVQPRALSSHVILSFVSHGILGSCCS